MNKGQENKLNMYEGVDGLFNENQTVVQSYAPLAKAGADLTVKITEIKKKDEEKSTTGVGKTQVKSIAKNHLIDKTLKVSSLMYTWAVDNNKPEVKELCSFSKSDLSSIRDTELPIKAKVIHDAAAANLVSLKDYQVNREVLNELNETITTYSNALQVKETKSALKVDATASLKNLFHEADMILKERIDRFVEGLKNKEPRFYGAYKAARRIRDL